jgi:hypothetical protein
MTDTLDDLYEELEYLCEVDPEAHRISEIESEIKELRGIGSRWG